MANETKKLSDAQSFFLILIFAIAGFTVIMLGTLNNKDNNNNSNEVVVNESNLDLIAKDFVLSSYTFQKFSDSNLIYESKKKLDCFNCFEFSFKFSAVEHDELPTDVVGFRYIVKLVNDEVVSSEVIELL